MFKYLRVLLFFFENKSNKNKNVPLIKGHIHFALLRPLVKIYNNNIIHIYMLYI